MYTIQWSDIPAILSPPLLFFPTADHANFTWYITCKDFLYEYINLLSFHSLCIIQHITNNIIEVHWYNPILSCFFTARNKFALLICNSEYPGNELRTPQLDAEMLARELAMLQFRCFIYSNVTRSEFRSAARLFSEYIQKGDYGKFYQYKINVNNLMSK